MSAVVVRLGAGETVGFAHARVAVSDKTITVYSTKGECPLLAIYSLTYIVGAQVVDDGALALMGLTEPDELDVLAPCPARAGGASHALSLVEGGYVRVWSSVDYAVQPDGRIVVSEAGDDNEAYLDGDGDGAYRLSCHRCGKSAAAEVTEDTSWT